MLTPDTHPTLTPEVVAAIAHYWQALDAVTAIDDEAVPTPETAALWQASELAAMELGALVAALAPVSLYRKSAATPHEPT